MVMGRGDSPLWCEYGQRYPSLLVRVWAISIRPFWYEYGHSGRRWVFNEKVPYPPRGPEKPCTAPSLALASDRPP